MNDVWLVLKKNQCPSPTPALPYHQLPINVLKCHPNVDLNFAHIFLFVALIQQLFPTHPIFHNGLNGNGVQRSQPRAGCPCKRAREQPPEPTVVFGSPVLPLSHTNMSSLYSLSLASSNAAAAAASPGAPSSASPSPAFASSPSAASSCGAAAAAARRSRRRPATPAPWATARAASSAASRAAASATSSRPWVIRAATPTARTRRAVTTGKRGFRAEARRGFTRRWAESLMMSV